MLSSRVLTSGRLEPATRLGGDDDDVDDDT
jgi:hypothetical protein